MDPYQNLRPHTPYPAVLLSVGLNDSRVSNWETGKFAAGLQADTSRGRPVWIRADAAAGHFAGGSPDGVAMLAADIYSFLETELQQTPAAATSAEPSAR